MDATRPSLCHSQEFHFHPSPTDGSGDAQGRQGPTTMGLEYWEAEAEKQLKTKGKGKQMASRNPAAPLSVEQLRHIRIPAPFSQPYTSANITSISLKRKSSTHFV